MKKALKMMVPLAVAVATLMLAETASADIVGVRGKIVVTQGHVSPACRMVQLRRNDNGTYIWFRIAATGQEDGVLANTLTAIATGLDVDIYYD